MCKMNKKYFSVFIILTVLLSGCTKENADISAGGASASEAAESAPAPEPEQADLAIDFEGTDIE